MWGGARASKWGLCSYLGGKGEGASCEGKRMCDGDPHVGNTPIFEWGSILFLLYLRRV